MNLFDLNKERELEKSKPLADRMRPENLDDFFGQNHLTGGGKIINRMIKADRIYSMIFYGPPGVGKTTLASIISKTTKMNFEKISAVSSGINDVKNKIKIAEENLSYDNKKTILFIDEIHRFNKSQQDYLLPFVENGTIILIGATTENPYFEVNKALISRMYVFEFKPLNESSLNEIINNALKKDKIFSKLDIKISDEARKKLIKYSNGDSRSLLNALEIAVFSEKENNGTIEIESDTIENSIQKKLYVYDKNATSHYDTISALIKSIRGSDPDASLYYLALMLESGEDIKFIARRLVILASEDIGNANPMALILAESCFNAIEKIGMPEARIILAQTVIYLSTSLKSNSAYVAIDKAINFVKNERLGEVPNKLKDSHYKESNKIVKDKYKYPHDFGGYVDQDYLPDEYIHKSFYKPKEIGYEEKINEYLKKINYFEKKEK
ncbi:MAG: replication-associated recombination protein A [Peptoniphilaceae bacterium]|nr:replication-associated recombination protein A [Peptoniphilaceae bacterium]MDD7383588.1 replication-associated recombination protein A [Peptoniphilaceae bacterium]MDY3738760.1 replication-associated recombination protein A [Peptoniphilaceae bacterium]